MVTRAIPPLVTLLSFAISVALFAGEAWAKGGSRSSSRSSSSSTSKTATTEKETRRPEINIDLSTRGGSSAPAQAAAAARPGAAAAGAAAAGTAGAAVAPGGPKDTPDEARKRIDQRDAQLKAEQDEKARRRAEDEKLAALAARDREIKAELAEKERIARQQRAQQALGGSTAGCVFKPVMTDAEISACRK